MGRGDDIARGSAMMSRRHSGGGGGSSTRSLSLSLPQAVRKEKNKINCFLIVALEKKGRSPPGLRAL